MSQYNYTAESLALDRKIELIIQALEELLEDAPETPSTPLIDPPDPEAL